MEIEVEVNGDIEAIEVISITMVVSTEEAVMEIIRATVIKTRSVNRNNRTKSRVKASNNLHLQVAIQTEDQSQMEIEGIEAQITIQIAAHIHLGAEDIQMDILLGEVATRTKTYLTSYATNAIN
jgi:hypothetical protein